MSLSASVSAASLGARSRVAGARLPRSARCVLPARPRRGTRAEALLRPYTVRTGDRLETIASKRGMSVKEVRECNKGRTLSAEVKARPHRLFAHSRPVYPYTLAGSIHGPYKTALFPATGPYKASFFQLNSTSKPFVPAMTPLELSHVTPQRSSS